MKRKLDKRGFITNESDLFLLIFVVGAFIYVSKSGHLTKPKNDPVREKLIMRDQ